MISLKSTAASLVLSSALLLAVASGTAQAAAISFVASNGKDINPCSRAKPCRTLQEGVDKASDGGDVVVLDSGFYGNNLNITKSITISANGVTASLRRITIDNAGATVILRGLLLIGKGAPVDTDGINIVDAAFVHIEDCLIERFPRDGILAFADPKLFVARTAARHNGRYGLEIFGSGAARTALTVDSSQLENNAFGGIRAGLASTSITRSVLSSNAIGLLLEQSTANVARTTAANNANDGYQVVAQPGNPGELTLEHSTARGNDMFGLVINSLAIARIANSVITENGTGIDSSNLDAGDDVLTRGNNTIAGNVDNHNGDPLATLTPQ